MVRMIYGADGAPFQMYDSCYIYNILTTKKKKDK